MIIVNITEVNKKNRVTGKDYISIKEECKVFISLFCPSKKGMKKGRPTAFLYDFCLRSLGLRAQLAPLRQCSPFFQAYLGIDLKSRKGKK